MRLQTLVSFLCLLIALVILWQFRQILLLLFTAVVLAIALNSLIRMIQRRLGWARGRAMLAAIALVLFGVALVIAIVLPPFINQFQQLLTLIPQGFNHLRDWLTQVTTNPPPWLPEDLEPPDFPSIIQQLGGVSSRVFGNFVTFFSSSAAIVLQLLLVSVMTLMLASDPLAYRRLLIRLFPSHYRHRADEILDKCETALIGWLGGVCLSSLFVGLISFLGLLALRVDFAFAHAVLAGVFNFIPNIGPALSAIFPLGVALSNSISSAIAVVILYVVIQNLESYALQPTIMRHQVSLLPAATLISQLFFATFFGPVGLVLALPLTVVSRVWLEEALVKDYLDHPPQPARVTEGHSPGPSPPETGTLEPSNPPPTSPPTPLLPNPLPAASAPMLAQASSPPTDEATQTAIALDHASASQPNAAAGGEDLSMMDE